MARILDCQSKGCWFDSAVSKLRQLRSPHFACVHQSCCSIQLARGVYAREVKDPTHENGESCCSSVVDSLILEKENAYIRPR